MEKAVNTNSNKRRSKNKILCRLLSWRTKLYLILCGEFVLIGMSCFLVYQVGLRRDNIKSGLKYISLKPIPFIFCVILAISMYTLIVLIHELGHAVSYILAWRKCKVVQVDKFSTKAQGIACDSNKSSNRILIDLAIVSGGITFEVVATAVAYITCCQFNDLIQIAGLSQFILFLGNKLPVYPQCDTVRLTRIFFRYISSIVRI